MFQNNLRHNGSRKVAQGASKASLRAKSFVFDRKEVFIGSLNLDPREIVYNTEIGVVLSSAGFARRMGGGSIRISTGWPSASSCRKIRSCD